MARRKRPPYPLESFFPAEGEGGKIQRYQSGSRIFAQREICSGLFFIRQGWVRLAFTCTGGKEATFALRGPGDFFGEEYLTGRCSFTSSAIAFSDCTAVRIEREAIRKLLRRSPSFSEMFIEAMVRQGLRQQEDLTDHLLSSSEKRLARLLLSLGPLTQKRRAQPQLPRISQALLAEMVGTTRGRVSYFMNKFRKRGLIEYNGGLRVNRARLKSILD